MKHLWLQFSRADAETEHLQAAQEGRDLPAFEHEFLSAHTHEDVCALLDKVQAAPLRSDFRYIEPSSLEGIRANAGAQAAPRGKTVSLSKLTGAWLGRCCGCLLGKPVEGWTRKRLHGYLKEIGAWPLSGYISADADIQVQRQYDVNQGLAWKENISAMPEDDDLNYTVAALAILKKYGRAFAPQDVGAFWLENIPILHTCTAERVAYKNLINGLVPPDSASYRNPYREWIGAQIRADMWGYVNPGDPRKAAEMAWRDACISHVKNGIYGEIWVAAMIAMAFCESEPIRILGAALSEIPQKSRLHEAISKQIRMFENQVSVDDAILGIHERWDENRPHDWCHTIPNAEIVAIALLWGEKDFSKSICLAVQSCFDTDCNGATVGSILGAMFGEEAIADEWKRPLNDSLRTGVQGYHEVKISALAEETFRIIEGGNSQESPP